MIVGCGWPQKKGRSQSPLSFPPFQGSLPNEPLSRLWNMKALPRVIIFGRLALRGGIRTVDNLHVARRSL